MNHSFFLGTPIVIARSNELRKSNVLDQQGRSRFHGAFEGGITAGYYNTVGSAQGWRPAQYERGKIQRVEDYMDDEDQALFGDKITAREKFLDVLGEEREAKAAKEVWGDPSSSFIPGPIPKELLSFSDNMSSVSGGISIGMKLFNLSHQKGAEINERRIKKREAKQPIEKLIGVRGLGFRGNNEFFSSFTSTQAPIESPEVLLWKQRHGLQNQRDFTGMNEEEAITSKRGRHDESKLSYHVIEEETDKDNQEVSQVSNKILTKLQSKTKQAWPDGMPLPTGFVLAKYHDPEKFLNVKRQISTEIPPKVSSKHEFGDLKVIREETASKLRPAPQISRQAQLQKYLSLEKESKLDLASKFVSSRETKIYSPIAESSISSSIEALFRRLPPSNWEPNENTLKYFGVVSSSNLSSSSSNKQATEAPLKIEARPSLAQFRSILLPELNKGKFDFDSSEDEIETPAVTGIDDGESSTSSSVSKSSTRKHSKKKKHRSKHKKKHKSSKKRHKHKREYVSEEHDS